MRKGRYDSACIPSQNKMDIIKIIFTIMVSGMADSIGFALGIVAGATVITLITFSKQTEQKVLYIFGVIGMVIGTLCSMWFVVKLFWK